VSWLVSSANTRDFSLICQDALTGNIDVTKLPLHPSPPGIANGQLHVDLLPHQSQALQVSTIQPSGIQLTTQWMLEKEHPQLPKTPTDAPVQFWTKQKAEGPGGKDYWLNVATRTPQSDVPVLGRGGIIADGMGLGMSLSKEMTDL
jgi:SWI/SNF-related matrix-associated actin-dependent regulator of chromatin subfamily A3